MDRERGIPDEGGMGESTDEFAPDSNGRADAGSHTQPGWTSDESGRPAYVPPRGRAQADAARRTRGLTAEEAAKASQRAPHQQVVTFDDKQIINFDGVQFVAHLGNDAKFNRQGDLVITLLVPFEFKHLAIPLTNAFGIPLSVDIQVWRPFTDYEDITNGKIIEGSGSTRNGY